MDRRIEHNNVPNKFIEIHDMNFMLKKKFRCGRLVINRHGIVKKRDLIYGGGTRDCSLSNVDMGFDEIHDKIRGVFSLDKSNNKSELYDFQRQKLDTNRYPTFLDYVVKNGLKFNGTLLYLCTQEDDEVSIIRRSPEKRRKPTQAKENSSQKDNRIPRVEADSSTSPVVIKIEEISQTSHAPTNESVSSNHRVESLRTLSSTSSNYSFENELNEFVHYLRKSINQNNHEQLFVQLFEHLCTIRGLASINLDRLKRNIQSIDDKQRQVYNEVLDKIEQSTRSFKALLELNKIKISHMDRNSIIINSFNQFYQNFTALRNQWINNSSNDRENTLHCPATRSIDSQLSTNVSSSSSSSSSSRHYSGTHSRKQARILSPSPQRSSTIAPSSSRHHVEPNHYKQSRICSPSSHQSSSSTTQYYLEANIHNQGRTQSSYHRHPSGSSRNNSETNTRTQTGSSSSYSRPSSSSTRYSSENNSRKPERISSSSSHQPSSSSSSSSTRNYLQSDFRKQTRGSSASSSSSRNYSETNDSKQPQIQSSSSVRHSSSSSRNYSQTNSREVVQSKLQSTDQSSSSHQQPSETRTRSEGRASYPSSHRPSSQVSNEENKNKNHSLFQNILKSLDYLMNTLNRLRYSSFASLIYSMMNEIQNCRTTIKLFDYRSLHDSEQLIVSIERRLANRMRDEHHRASPHGLDRQLEYAYNDILDEIGHLLNSLSNYKSQIDKNKQPRKTRWSSPNPSPSIELSNNDIKPAILSNQNEQNEISIDDDQSSEASHSSLGDEVLMEVARDAYEKRLDRHK